MDLLRRDDAAARGLTMADDLRDELRHRVDEPFLPAERKLVAWSLIVGVALLGILVWVSETFFAP